MASIPTSLLCKILGVDTIPVGRGYTLRGNFYKCGDECVSAHHGMWNVVEVDAPDFHRPEYFGTLVID